ncbi:hypothetical protein EYC95_28925 [Pseudomonas sp. BGI-2]|nr:hypothetical protein EYC95_28925 [Pseudomonas sp. BGI-2]
MLTLPIIGLTPWNGKPAGAPAYAASGGKVSWVCGVCTEWYTSLRPDPDPVGVSLLAKAVGQSISMLNDRPLSRAGSLLQGMCVT